MQSAKLKAALGYRKFQSETPRVLVMDSGYLVVRDVVDGAEELGWHVARVETPKQGRAPGAFVGDLLKACLVHKPDFLITINHLGFDEEGVLANLLSDYEIPVASWFVDHPFPILGGAKGNATPTTGVFCFERTALGWLANQGFSDPVYLPTGSNRTIFHPDKVNRERAQELSCDVSFVGNSWWTKARVEPDAWIKKAAEQIMKKHSVDKHAVAEDFIQNIERISFPSASRRAKYQVAQVALAEASMKTRQRFAKALVPVGLEVYGDPYWEQLVPGLTRHAGIDYEQGLPVLFEGTTVNTNVTAEHMPTALNQRVWDVPGTGNFLLTDAQEDALEFFTPEEDIAVYRSFEEAADKARFYLNNPDLAETIGKRGFEKIEKFHRTSHRLEQMNSVMKSRYA